MKVIPVCDLNNATLVDVFNENQLHSEVTVVYAGEPALGLDEDAYVKVFYPEGQAVIFWILPNESLLKMRTVLLGRTELDLLSKQAQQFGIKINWDEKLAFENQNAGGFGTLNVNLVGLTLDYALPYSEGVLDETVLLSGENLVRGAKRVWTIFEITIDRVLRKANQNQ